MTEHISLREWQKRFLSGEYNNPDRKTQIAAGWFDWFCRDSSLKNKTIKISKILLKINNDYILDNYYVFFKNCCPMYGSLYDRIVFNSLNDKPSFGIDIDRQYTKEKTGCKYELWLEVGNGFKSFYYKTQKELLVFLNSFKGI